MKSLRSTLVITLALLTGCATWEGLSPGAQASLKAAARIALSFAVGQLGDRVKELRPYQGKLSTLLEATFSKASGGEDIGAALKAGVIEIVPAVLVPIVLVEFKAALADKTTAAGPQSARQVAYNASIVSKL